MKTEIAYFLKPFTFLEGALAGAGAGLDAQAFRPKATAKSTIRETDFIEVEVYAQWAPALSRGIARTGNAFFREEDSRCANQVSI